MTVRLLAACSVIAVSIVAYLPAVDNFFISDDFVLIPYLSELESDPLRIVDSPSEMFRMVTYAYFWVFLKLFGVNSVTWYWAGIALHAAASLLVFRLVYAVSFHFGAAWAAALFFAAYERHQEAVMWISAFNDLIMTFNCLLFLVLWERALAGSRIATGPYLAALAMFLISLFSKEGAVALFPLALLWLVLRGFTYRQIVQYGLPLALLLVLHLTMWLSFADRNFFVADGHYAFGLHFVPVYLRALVRLAAPVLVFAAPLLFIQYWRGSFAQTPLPVFRGLLFLLMLLVFSILPYSFLTYLDHIPSRNTYFPSVGMAGILGLSFAMLYAELRSSRLKYASLLMLLVMVAGNVGYIWVKKEPQFRARSAPTRELIAALNEDQIASSEGVIHICGFPLDPWFGYRAVADFTQVDVERIAFHDECDGTSESVSLSWDESSSQYLTIRNP